MLVPSLTVAENLALGGAVVALAGPCRAGRAGCAR